MTALPRVLLTSLLLAVGVGLVPTEAPAAVTVNPCLGGSLAKAPTLAGDRAPGGQPVAETPLVDGTYIPVVMVHGWIGRSVHNDARTGAFSALIDLTANKVGDANVGRSLIGQLQDAGGVAVYTFDYHDASARWVTDPAIGPELAEAITCLSGLHGRPAVLVTHSMGGLAARQALDIINRAGQGGAVSDVVTFGTPNSGSWLASVVDTLDVTAQLSAVLPGATGSGVTAVRSLLVLCGTATTRSLGSAGACGLLGEQLASARSVAGQALRVGSPEIRALAPWPGDVRVHGLGGSIDLELARVGWFGLSYSAGNVNTGDFVVSAASATHGSTDSRTVECSYTLDARAAAEDNIAANWLWLWAVNETRDNVYTNGARSACAHGNLMRSIELTNEALGVIAGIVDQANQGAGPRFTDINGTWCQPADPSACLIVDLPRIEFVGYGSGLFVYPRWDQDLPPEDFTYDDVELDPGGCWIAGVDSYPPFTGNGLAFCPVGTTIEWSGIVLNMTVNTIVMGQDLPEQYTRISP